MQAGDKRNMAGHKDDMSKQEMHQYIIRFRFRRFTADVKHRVMCDVVSSYAVKKHTGCSPAST